MKDISSVWDQLDLEATDDVRAIRRAYSRRLKAIDVDADPGAFIALRYALDTALALAATMAPAMEPIVSGGGDDGLSSATPRPRLEPPAEPERRETEEPGPDVQFADSDIDPAIPARLNTLLFDEGALGPSPDQILGLTKTLLAQAALARIDKVASLEAWLAVTIANAIPRSDVMIDPAVEHFRWADHAGSWQGSPAVAAILARQSDLRFLAEVSEPGHRLHAAYLALTGPPPRSALFVDTKLRAKIDALLSTAQRDHPKAVADFNAKTVAWWSSQGRRRPPNSAWRGLIGVGAVLAFLGLLRLVAMGVAALGSAGSQLATLVNTQSAPGYQHAAEDGCEWRKMAGGPQQLFCRDANGKMIQTAAPSDYGPTTLSRANGGDTAAMVAMGRFYSAGPPIVHDGGKAQVWFRRAADLGDPAAMLDLGLLNGTGAGVTGDGANLAEAARWYRAAADHGLPQAQYMLGDLYRRGVGVPHDDSQAVALFRQAADKGWAPAKSTLGFMYERGLGVGVSQAQAVSLYKEAASANDPAGEYYLASAYARGLGVHRSGAEAARLFQAAADKGIPEAMIDLAVLYHKGDGVPASDAHAVRLLQAAAGKGQAVAMYDLGLAYRAGIGVKKNDEKAAEWFRAAADAGAAAAIHQLEQMHAARQGPTARP